MAQQKSINILEFQQRLATDDACCNHLFKPEGGRETRPRDGENAGAGGGVA